VVRNYLGEHPKIVVEDLPGYVSELNADDLGAYLSLLLDFLDHTELPWAG
jgi:hypothetical protein